MRFFYISGVGVRGRVFLERREGKVVDVEGGWLVQRRVEFFGGGGGFVCGGNEGTIEKPTRFR